MEPSFRILYYGGILPGFDALLVRHRFQGLYRLTPEKATLIFSGQKIVLRRGLNANELPRYYTYLRSLGLQVFAEREKTFPQLDIPSEAEAEPQPAAVAPAQTYVPPRSNAVPSVREAPSPAAVEARLADIEFLRRSLVVEMPAAGEQTITAPIDEETCPRCGTMQYHRTLCRSCGADMPRLRAAQKARADEVRSALGREADNDDQAPSPLRVPLDARIGRLHYLALGCVAGLVLMLGCAGSLWLASLPPLLVGGALAAVIAILATVLRLHDLNTTGWMAPAILVPWAGLIVGIVLLAAPGSSGSNRFGHNPGSLGWSRTSGYLLMMCGSALLLGQLMLARADVVPALATALEMLPAEWLPYL